MQGDPESPYCKFCHHNSIEEGAFSCDDCDDKLEALMKATTALETPSYQYEPSIEFKNVKLSTDYPGEAVVAIDGSGAAGVQKPFRFDGQGKCVICDELTTDMLVCALCKGGVSLARQIMSDNAGEFLHLFQDEGFVALMKFVASGAVRQYMEAEIDDFGKS